jgi:hypothetical protein
MLETSPFSTATAVQESPRTNEEWRSKQQKLLKDPNKRAVIDLAMYNAKQVAASMRVAETAKGVRAEHSRVAEIDVIGDQLTAVVGAMMSKRGLHPSVEQIRGSEEYAELAGLAQYITMENRSFPPQNRYGTEHNEVHRYGEGSVDYYHKIADKQVLPVVQEAFRPHEQMVAPGVGSLALRR